MKGKGGQGVSTIRKFDIRMNAIFYAFVCCLTLKCAQIRDTRSQHFSFFSLHFFSYFLLIFNALSAHAQTLSFGEGFWFSVFQVAQISAIYFTSLRVYVASVFSVCVSYCCCCWHCGCACCCCCALCCDAFSRFYDFPFPAQNASLSGKKLLKQISLTLILPSPNHIFLLNENHFSICYFSAHVCVCGIGLP